MKTRFILFFVILISLGGCCEKAEPDPTKPDYNAEYYIRYEFKAVSSDPSRRADCQVNYIDENGNKVDIDYYNINTLDYTIVRGPYKYGDTIETQLICGWCFMEASLEIFISKNNSPFISKKKETSSRFCYITYRIGK